MLVCLKCSKCCLKWPTKPALKLKILAEVMHKQQESSNRKRPYQKGSNGKFSRIKFATNHKWAKTKKISNSQRELIWTTQQSSCLPHLLSVMLVGKHIHTKRTKVRGYLDLVFFITHYSVFTTYNSKLVDFMTV